MTVTAAFSMKRFLVAATLAGCMFAMAGPALAQSQVSGCDQRVLTAMQAKAEAHVAYDIAATEEIIDKPDSVLAMTCFNAAASISAVQGGRIFSNPTGNGFINSLSPIITNALTAFYDDFDDAIGFLTNTVDYTATALSAGATQNCDGIKDLWDEVTREGVQTGVPYVTMNDLMSGTPPGGVSPTSDFGKNWQSAATQGVFNGVQTAVNALPTPSVPVFTGNNSSCQVLMTLGLHPGPCP